MRYQLYSYGDQSIARNDQRDHGQYEERGAAEAECRRLVYEEGRRAQLMRISDGSVVYVFDDEEAAHLRHAKLSVESAIARMEARFGPTPPDAVAEAREAKSHRGQGTAPEPVTGELRHCRGFRPDYSGRPCQYTRFADLNGREVTVKYSTLAATAAVWIFTGPAEAQRMATEAVGAPALLVCGSAHLCRAMAREVRDALSAFLGDPVDPELACETRITER
jgi:hypothetical protein